ncbi:hypothetical protein Ahy_B06g084995 [Arachis hypogaea]|uniref:Uncharacterized protein n=1 Tax=Arachis hypogaea TaxID=3818 RepID=A0A444YT99_ARAHY|nr:hypothetical protein Ahy_B06g084995 [Arachis hypogaea]
MTHKKRDGSYIHPDARVVSEAIANVERQDGSSKHLSQNDSLAQVLGKEHPGRVRALGAGPCPTQVFGNAAGQPSGSAKSNAEDKRMIVELTAKLEEERVKRQSIHKVLGYVVQQLEAIYQLRLLKSWLLWAVHRTRHAQGHLHMEITTRNKNFEFQLMVLDTFCI